MYMCTYTGLVKWPYLSTKSTKGNTTTWCTTQGLRLHLPPVNMLFRVNVYKPAQYFVDKHTPFVSNLPSRVGNVFFSRDSVHCRTEAAQPGTVSLSSCNCVFYVGSVVLHSVQLMGGVI